MPTVTARALRRYLALAAAAAAMSVAALASAAPVGAVQDLARQEQ